MINIGDKFILHSENGMDYKIEICNINDFREPSMKYACLVWDGNGVGADDFLFFGDEFFQKNNVEKKINRS